MICEQVLGNLKSGDFADYEVHYVDIEWHETFKRLHKKVTQQGEEIGIRLGNDILKVGLKQGDVLYAENRQVIVVNIPKCKSIVIGIDENHIHMLGKVCYEIGNKHAALFWGENHRQLVTPYDKPTLMLLQKLQGINVKVADVKLDLEKGIQTTVHTH